MIKYQFTATRLDNGEPITGNLCELKDGTFIMPQDQCGHWEALETDWQLINMMGRSDRESGGHQLALDVWKLCAQKCKEIAPPLIAVDPATIRRSIDLGTTQDRSTEELQAESTQLRNEGNYILGKQKILADIISQRLRDAALATCPWKVGDTVEVSAWNFRKQQWIEGVCTDEVTRGGFNLIAAKTKSGAAHKSQRLRPDSMSGDAQYRFNGKCYTFYVGNTNEPNQYKEVQP